MKTKDLRKKSVEELNKDLLAFKKELFNLRFQSVYGSLTKPHRVGQVKTAVARIKTLLREMDLKKKVENA